MTRGLCQARFSLSFLKGIRYLIWFADLLLDLGAVEPRKMGAAEVQDIPRLQVHQRLLKALPGRVESVNNQVVISEWSWIGWLLNV